MVFKRLLDVFTLGSEYPIQRLIAYYTLLALVVFGLLQFFPVVDRLFSGERLAEIASTPMLLEDGLDPDANAVPEVRASLDLAVTTLLAFLAALALMLPVTWVYMSAKRERGHDQSIVQTLIVLPIVVAAIVLVVHNSLALAFSLAGIVAAVRFRTTVGDTRDIVFIFLAIAVGFATGVQVLTVAALVSVVFNFVVLFSWRYDFGRNVLEPTAGSVWADPLNEMAETGGNGNVPDRDLVLALTPKKAQALSERFDRLSEILGSDGNKPRFNAVLSIRTDVPGDTQPQVEKVLEEVAKRWKLDEVVTHQGKPTELYYLIRIGKGTSRDELLTAIRAGAGDELDSADVEIGDALAQEQGEKRKKRKQQQQKR
jgi:hypothetical protein